MAENERIPETGEGGFKEAVCIDAMRIYDTCSAKDCLEDLRVILPASQTEAVNNATGVRLRDAKVLTVYLDLQPVPFDKGFYSVDMTFFFEVTVDLFSGPNTCPCSVCGVSIFNKKVVLYGSEGNVKMYSSGDCTEEMNLGEDRVLPKATVQVAEPVALSARLCERPLSGCDPYCRIPDCICQRYGGQLETGNCRNHVYVTIGLFTIVQITRNVQMMIPACDFCVPEKECTPSSDNPCELFRRIDFPMGEFFPPRATDLDGGKCCK